MTHDYEIIEHKQLQEERHKPSIGGSTASIIALESAGQPVPFGRSMFEEWLRLTGRKPDSQEDNDRFEMGRLLEEPIAIRFQRKTGLTVEKVPMLVHPSYEWVTGHMDRAVIEEPGDVEIKTVGWYRERDQEWSNPNQGEAQRVPVSYLLQPIWYAGIPRMEGGYLELADSFRQNAHPSKTLGAFERKVYVAAQFDLHQPLRIYQWECDETIRKIHERMFEACQRFWEDYVLKNEPPPARSVNDQRQWLRLKFPQNVGKQIEEVDSPRLIEVAKAYEEARAKEKAAKEEKDKLGIELGRMIGSAYGLRASHGGASVTVTYPLVKMPERVLEATEFRRFHVTVKDSDNGT